MDQPDNWASQIKHCPLNTALVLKKQFGFNSVVSTLSNQIKFFIILSVLRQSVQGRSQEFAMGGCFGGLGGGPSSCWRHGDLGAEPQRLKTSHFFAKMNLILELLRATVF